ncbi:hypothetical protein [Burkholderia perseverans]|uniref:hypothetical protein n=1 Tax=Burkholderia perseverans TaxID=2615214 RepID=UPI001FEDD168|nr:hypothetical protein [Burkholderia perseverans]
MTTGNVAVLAASGGLNAATAGNAAKIEGENNQVAPLPLPGMGMAGGASQDLPPGIPGYKGEERRKGDGVIADPATELDPGAKAGALVTPLPGPRAVEALITASPPSKIKQLVEAVLNAVGGAGGGSSFWSSTKKKTSVENAYEHSIKHGSEFPENANAAQYVRSAQDFVNNPPPGTLIKNRPNGDVLYYDPSTNTFASKNKDGAPKTMFKPSAGIDYWSRQ